MIRVGLVDDHPALREGTAALLEKEPDLVVVGLAGTVAEARALVVGPEPPDVLVVDIRLGGERGLDLLLDPGAPAGRRPAIVVWTAFDVPQYAAFAFRSGAAGFVVKTAPVTELVAAIRHAAAGGLHFTTRPDLASRPLSERERQVLGHLVAGRSNDEIGAAMGIITRTVEAHLTRLFERYDVGSRTELAARAAREGWLDVPPDPPLEKP